MNMEDLERRLRVMEDVEEIKRLKARYCAYCDDNYNATAIASLFTEDAVWDGGIRGRADGRQGIHDFFFQASQRLPFAIHMVMNPDIEVNGDTATGSWYRSKPAPTPKIIRRYGGRAGTTRSMSGWTVFGCSST